ncbi:MAG: FtsX-like permease family protein [Fimbriimonadales bacterium]
MSRTLGRKLWRELWRARWQYGSVALMIMLGVAFFAGISGLYLSLKRSLHASYERYRLEHFRITMRSAPASVVEQLRRLEGVAAVEGRLVEPVILELGNVRTRRLTGRLIGIETRRPLQVNRLHLLQGRLLHGAMSREALLESRFAAYHGLQPRDTLTIRWRNERARLTIAGVIRSPEYIYVIQSKQQVLPSEDVFGVLFAARETVGALTGQPGRINEVCVSVREGYDATRVARSARQLLAAYDPEPPVLRKDQPSYYVLESSLDELRTFAVFFPVLFLSVSILTLYTLLMRLITQQRHVIGLLRALGYTRAQVSLHYLSAALLVGLVGGVCGAPLALALSDGLSRLYLAFLALPVIELGMPWTQIGIGGVMALGATLISGVQPALQASRIPPAQALRAAAPTVGRVWSMDRYIPFLNRARLRYRLPLRNLSRSWRRTLVGVLGIALGVMMAMLARGIMDSRDAVLADYFAQVLSEDVRVGFAQPQDASIVHRVRGWRGVAHAEGVLELPVRLRRGARAYDALLRAVEPDSPRLRLLTEAGAPVALTGLVCGQVVQERLGLERGDVVALSLPAELLDESPVETPMRVHGLVWETIGTVVYMPRDQALAWLRRQMQTPPNAINSLRLWVRPEYRREIIHALNQLPDIGAIVVSDEIIQRFRQLDALARQFFYFMMAFGMVLAVGVIFSVVTISVLERRSEIATLLTIGFRRREVYGLILGENMLLVTLGVLLGLVFGRVMVFVAIQALVPSEQAELIAFRPHITWQTYAFTALLSWGVGLLAQFPALHTMTRIDLVAALKERVS